MSLICNNAYDGSTDWNGIGYKNNESNWIRIEKKRKWK